MKKTLELLGAVVCIVAVGSAFSVNSFPVERVRASPNLWFVSWMDSDTGTAKTTFSYLFSFADVQTATIQIYTDWNDGSSSVQSASGTWSNQPTGYSGSPTISHYYASPGTFTVTITLSDSFGNSATKPLTVSISQSSASTYALGGKSSIPE